MTLLLARPLVAREESEDAGLLMAARSFALLGLSDARQTLDFRLAVRAQGTENLELLNNPRNKALVRWLTSFER